jgi:predicted ATPase
VTLLLSAPQGSIALIEQPEIHLHPSAQAHLADLFLEVAERRRLQLIIESHSEHLLARLQRRIAETEYPFANPDNIKMYFCQAEANGSTIQSVEIDDYGQIANWPDNFFGDMAGDVDAKMDAALNAAARSCSVTDYVIDTNV